MSPGVITNKIENRVMKNHVSRLIAGIYLLALIGSSYGAEYRVMDLQALAGPDGFQAAVGYGLNDLGQVCGHGFRPDLTDGRAQPFFADPYQGIYSNLGDMAGEFDSLYGGNGYAINNAGWVVGRNEDRSGAYHAFCWIDANGNGQREMDEMLDLADSEPYNRSYAGEVSNTGWVCGYSYYYTGDGNVNLGWLWRDQNGNGQPEQNEKIYTADLIPNGVNEAGQLALTGRNQGWRWVDLNGNLTVDEAELVSIPNTVNGASVSSDEIDATGRVAGVMKNALNVSIGYLWTDANGDNIADLSEIITFGTPFKNTFVRNMNDQGQIVGGCFVWDMPYGRAAYVWDSENGQQNLNDLIETFEVPGRGPLYLSQAEAINNRGQIMVSGWFDDNGDNKKGSTEIETTLMLTPIVSGDMNQDADLDMQDLGMFSMYWLQDGCTGDATCSLADLDGNTEVEIPDLITFVENWLTNAHYR